MLRRSARSFRLLLLVCSALAVPTVAVAQEPALEQLPSYLLDHMTRGGTFDDVFKLLRQQSKRHDYDRNGLDSADLAIAEQIETAKYRSTTVTQLVMLDLDGSGEVTKEEATRATTYQYLSHGDENENQQALQKRVDQSIERLMAMDANADGTVTLSEAISAPLSEQRDRRRESAESLLMLDPDRDGRLTTEELEQLARQAFQAADYDHDGTLSNNELKLVASARDSQRQIERSMPCDLPKPAAEDFVAVLGTYSGAWQPTVTVAGQDATTHLAVIDIEAGDRPLYLVLNSFYPMIWKFTGATDRLSRVVAVRHGKGDKAPQTAGAGVIGVAADKVTFLPPQSCGRAAYKADSKEVKLTARVIAHVTGRDPDATLAAYSPRVIAAPSGTESEKTEDKDLVIVPGGGDDVVVVGKNSKIKVVEGSFGGQGREDWLANRANLLAIDPADVLAPGAVETYEVLPKQYGLRQLVEEGKLERTEDGYRILQPISRFPTGLNGAHGVTFYLPEGMPMPAGDLGHSQLVLEKKTP